MVEYIPFEDVDPFLSSSEVENPEVDKFHLRLSTNSLVFNKANQEKTLLLTNVGWGKLPFSSLVQVNNVFVITENLPDLLLPGESYPVTILYNTGANGTVQGGLYVDVGDSYGNKFVSLTGNIT